MENGELKIPPKERLEELLKRKSELAGVPVILSGRHGAALDFKPPTTEARAMCAYLQKYEWPSKIYLEEKSLDTIGNGYFSKQIVDKHHWRRLLVITSDYHIKRTRWIFKKIFGADYHLKFLSAPSVKFQEKQEKEKRSLAFTKKIIGRLTSKNFSLANHPFYSKTAEAQKIFQEIMSIKI